MSVNTKVNGQLVKSAGLYKASVPIQNGDIYSLEERQIGVWTDGKPLYQKTIDFGTLPNTSLKSVAHGISDLENAFIVGAFSKNSTGVIIPLPYATSTAGDQMQVYVDATNINIRPQGNATSFTTTFVTIQYTKTTDVAGSGEYVPSGDKAVHYSTDEQVIGTWIDGSTLYQKTIEVSSTEVANHTKTDSDITNADVLLIEDGYYMINNGLKLALNQFESTSAYTRTGFRDDNSLYFYVNGYTSCQGAVVTIRYTKTS